MTVFCKLLEASARRVTKRKRRKRAGNPVSHLEFYHKALQRCLDSRDLIAAKLLHSQMIQTQFRSADISLGNKLLSLYCKLDSPQNAHKHFDEMPLKDVISWTALISAYARNGCPRETLTLFQKMRENGVFPNQFTYSAILPSCATMESVKKGKEIHVDIIRCGFMDDLFAGNALIDMYCKCGSVEDARQVFGRMPERDVVSWNSLLSGLAINGLVEEAWEVFLRIPERDRLSWTLMVSGCAQNGYSEKALELFKQMQIVGMEPVSNTFASALSACADLGFSDLGTQVHREVILTGIGSDLSVQNALMGMYAKCKMLESSLQIFRKMSQRNVVSWTCMIGAYVLNEKCDEALKLFAEMRCLGSQIRPNSRTYVALMPAVAEMAHLDMGFKVHGDIIKGGFQTETFVGNALIDMYAKCGSIETARLVFDKMIFRDVVSWTVMIAGYALHGQASQALELFEMMQACDIQPTQVTFLALLNACCHAGLVTEGKSYFTRMTSHYKIHPSIEHYCCMVDLIGRAGHLSEAEKFINEMPASPDVTVWLCLLGACSFHSNIEMATKVAEIVTELDPRSSAPYVILSNMYAALGRWDDIEKIRRLMKGRKVKKVAGCSWVEVNVKSHAFLADEK